MILLERVLSMGITGSGKSYQWLKLAEALLPTGAKFRVIDTDNDIIYMLYAKFPHLLPQNGGNVYVMPAFDWPEYEEGVNWVQQKNITPERLAILGPEITTAYKTPVQPKDWVVVDKVNNAWSTVQRYFTGEVFGANMGEYFLQTRKKIQAAGGAGKGGKQASSVSQEALDGWKDWSVINKLYEDFINPLVYRVRCHVYMATDVDTLDRTEKDPELISLFGELHLKPVGQKKLGGQMHTIFLLIPGTDRWFVTTVKDRAGRPYFSKVPLKSLYMQYLVAKAGWSPA